MQLTTRFFEMGYPKFKLLLFLVSLIYSNFSISQDWNQMSIPVFSPRDDAVAFSTGDKLYFGTGRDAGFQYLKDFYAYDFKTQTWESISQIEGLPRQYSSSFSFENKGCILNGIASNNTLLNEMQCYEPSSDAWELVPDFPGAKRLQSSSFEIGQFGYCGNGRSLTNTFDDWYRYDLELHQWNSIADYPIPAFECISFSIAGLGYVGLGKDLQGNYNESTYKYNPLNDSWTKIAAFPGANYTYATAFEMNDKAYVCTGQDSTDAFTNEFWEYDPAIDSWTQLQQPDFPYRRGCVGAILGTCFHLLAGIDSSFTRLNEHWTFCNADEDRISKFKIYPNPTSNDIMILLDNVSELTVKVYSIDGTFVDEFNVDFGSYVYDMDSYLAGLYFFRVDVDGFQKQVIKVIKI